MIMVNVADAKFKKCRGMLCKDLTTRIINPVCILQRMPQHYNVSDAWSTTITFSTFA